MPTVDLITYCCPKDIERTYAGFNALVDSHLYDLHEIILIRQRCRGIEIETPLERECRILESEDYNTWIREEFGIKEDDPEAEKASPYETKFYWKWNCLNPLIGLRESTADYIAFTDCDNLLRGDTPGNSWIDRGLVILQEEPDCFMVSPSHGSNGRDQPEEAVSQCMFLCERERFLNLDYDAPMPEGREMGGYHYMFEGRLWRYSQHYGVYRVMLGNPPTLIHLAW